MAAKAQVDMDPALKKTAEGIIRTAGLTPAAVITGLYKQIAATGKIPLGGSLMSKQMVALELQHLSKHIPIQDATTEEGLKEFFSELCRQQSIRAHIEKHPQADSQSISDC